MEINTIKMTNKVFTIRVMKVFDGDFIFRVTDIKDLNKNAGVLASSPGGIFQLTMDKHGVVDFVIEVDKLHYRYSADQVIPGTCYDDFIDLIKSMKGKIKQRIITINYGDDDNEW